MPQSARSLDPRQAAAHFERHFGSLAGARFARAPGRVNLIGEHIDYHDLPVLPIAIQRGVGLLFRPRADRRVVVHNQDARWGSREFELAADIEPFAQGDWGNYVKAAAQILWRRAGVRSGIEAVVHGDVPPAAGLSSSAALVVAAALALIEANGRPLERLELASWCAEGEAYVGTRGGGMDQAISLCAERGHASRISFAPLAAASRRLPESWRFLVAHSRVVADKSGAARRAYNELRADGEAALASVARELALAPGPTSFEVLCAGVPAQELLDRAARVLPPRLLARFRHVVTERQRVAEACEALRSADGRRLGELIDASHTSLAVDCEVSRPELDRLVALARAHGALGARLTGAGFGGCIVALCESAELDRVRSGLARDFYGARDRESALDEWLWIAEPSDGARVDDLSTE